MQYPTAVESVILIAEKSVGRTILDRNEKNIHVVDIAVLPEHRNKGFGSAALGELRQESARDRSATDS